MCCVNPENGENICINCFSLCLSFSLLFTCSVCFERVCAINMKNVVVVMVALVTVAAAAAAAVSTTWQCEWNTSIATITLSTLN